MKHRRFSFPQAWYGKVADALGITEYQSDYSRKAMQRCRSFFIRGFSPDQVVTCLPYLEANPRFWKTNLTPILERVRNENEKEAYRRSAPSVRETGMKSMRELLTKHPCSSHTQ